MLAHILLADRLTYRALFGTFHALMEPSKRTNIRRFLGGVVCGVLGILLFESHGTAAALAGGIGGFALGAFLPSLATFWRYLRSVPSTMELNDDRRYDAVRARRNFVAGSSALLLVGCWIILPIAAEISLDLISNGFVGKVSPLWQTVASYTQMALMLFVILNIFATIVAVSTYVGTDVYMPINDLCYRRLNELPISTVWRRQSRHLIVWTFCAGIDIMMTVGVLTAIWLLAGLKSGRFATALRRWTLAVRGQSAKYVVSALVSVVTMLACAFAAEPYLGGRLLPWIALGTGALCGGASLLAPIALSRERYDEAIERLRPMLHEARTAHGKIEDEMHLVIDAWVPRFQQSRLGRALEPLPSLMACGNFRETISF